MQKQKVNKKDENAIVLKMQQAFDSFAAKMKKLQAEAETNYRDSLKKAEKEKIQQALAQIKKIVTK